MTWRTHLLGGLSALWVMEVVPGSLTVDNLAPCALAAGLGALLPDLDANQSKIRSLGVGGVHPFVPLAWLANRAFGHRGLLHSWAGLAGMGIIAAALSFWWGWAPALALWLGYASHLALDACTPSGLPLSALRRSDRPGFHPRFHLLPPRLWVVTGSPEEDLFLTLLAGAVLLLLLHLIPSSSPPEHHLITLI